MRAKEFWKAILRQDAEAMRSFFSENAYINWHCTNERFTVDAFIRVNCEYPGHWDGTVERIEQIGDLLITVTRVFEKEGEASFHVVSFIRLENDKIISMDEYWGDDGIAPQWRTEENIGEPIRCVAMHPSATIPQA